MAGSGCSECSSFSHGPNTAPAPGLSRQGFWGMLAAGRAEGPPCWHRLGFSRSSWLSWNEEQPWRGQGERVWQPGPPKYMGHLLRFWAPRNSTPQIFKGCGHGKTQAKGKKRLILSRPRVG